MLKYITPRIRFQEFDFWWETIKLTDLGISVGGTAIESEFDPDGKYKVISIGSYSEESKYKDQGIRAIYSEKTEKRILEKDDLTMILNDKTSTGKIIGRVLLIDEDNSYVYNQRTQRICLDKNKYVPDFIFQLLNADINRNKIVRSAQGNTQIYVNWSDISNLDYLIPESIEEQSAIGSLFLTLDDLLASYKDNLANYQSLKATMLAKMFPKAGQTVPEIRLDGFEGEWEKLKLRDVVHTNPKSELPENFKYIDLESVVGTRINKIREERKESAPSRAQRLAKKGDVFYQTVRPYQKNNYLFKLDEIDYVFSTGYAQLRPIFKRCDSDFLLILLQNNRFLSKVLDRCTGTSYPAINVNDLIELLIAIPSYEEQQAIGAYFSNLDNLINSHQEKITQLETLKKKLLQDMFI